MSIEKRHLIGLAIPCEGGVEILGRSYPQIGASLDAVGRGISDAIGQLLVTINR
jgi:hypothetical protein